MATRRKNSHKEAGHWLVLVLLAIAQFVVVLDVTIVNVALPSMQKALNIAPENLQWIITAYTLAFGGFLLLGGRTADIIGRKKVFILGLLAFSLGSLLVGLASNESLVIVARGLQGLAGAFMTPAALAIVLATYREGSERNKALSVWGAVASSGAAAGLLLGGVITEYLDWRWNFFVNVPIGVLVAMLSWRFVPESIGHVGEKIYDVFGGLTVTSGLMLLVYGLTKAPQYGWTDGRTLTYLGIAAVLLAAFLINESRSRKPLLPLSFFAIRNVGRANLVMFPVVAGMFAVFFFLTLYVQNFLGYQPVKTGFAFLPVAIIIGMVAGIASQLVTKVGYKPLLVAGPLFIAGGMAYLSQLPPQGGYWTDVFPGLATFAVGMGLSFVSGTIAATTGVSDKDGGLASGLLNTTQQVGGAVGLAVLSAVAASSTTSFMAGLGGEATPQDVAAATLHGFQSAFYVAVGLSVAASVIALVLVKQRKGEKIEAKMVPGA